MKLRGAEEVNPHREDKAEQRGAIKSMIGSLGGGLRSWVLAHYPVDASMKRSGYILCCHGQLSEQVKSNPLGVAREEKEIT